MAPTPRLPERVPSTGLVIWLATSDAAKEFDRGSLSRADRARDAAIRMDRRRADFRVSRALLRHAASGRALQSLSHSAGHAALAQLTAATGLNVGPDVGPDISRDISPDIGLGVDLEQQRARDVRSLARFAFAPAEVDALLRLPDVPCRRRFYTLWTMKEALGKALGMPLLEALRQCVFLEGDGEWRLQAPVDAPCSVFAFEPRPMLMLAVAHVGAQAPACVRLREWPPDRAAAWPVAARINGRGDRPCDRPRDRREDDREDRGGDGDVAPAAAAAVAPVPPAAAP